MREHPPKGQLIRSDLEPGSISHLLILSQKVVLWTVYARLSLQSSLADLSLGISSFVVQETRGKSIAKLQRAQYINNKRGVTRTLTLINIVSSAAPAAAAMIFFFSEETTGKKRERPWEMPEKNSVAVLWCGQYS